MLVKLTAGRRRCHLISSYGENHSLMMMFVLIIKFVFVFAYLFACAKTISIVVIKNRKRNRHERQFRKKYNETVNENKYAFLYGLPLN